MKIQELLQEAKISLLATLVLLVLLCGIYPLVVWGVAQVAFSRQANGSLLEQQDKTVGSDLIAQSFTSPQYFHPRPSAAGEIGYDGTSSGGSNLGPLSQKLIDQVKERVAGYRNVNQLPADTLVPVDAVTASGSGLDPHISLKNAQLQTPRVAKARGISEVAVRKLLEKSIDAPDLGFLGEPGVNVLRLNLALDSLASATHAR
jgi:K+-transporting ATPase ATPase C chain